jgi:hypothetical protein
MKEVMEYERAPKRSRNNSIQFFIIYVPSQQPQGQIQTQHSVGTRMKIKLTKYTWNITKETLK